MVGMTNDTLRKKNTGEAGNGGQFAGHRHSEAEISLGEFVSAASSAREKATKDLEIGAAAAAAHIIQRRYPHAESFAPELEDDGEGGTYITGMLLFHKNGVTVETVDDDFMDDKDPDNEDEEIVDLARSMGKSGSNSWWAAELAPGNMPFPDRVSVSRAVEWAPDQAAA